MVYPDSGFVTLNVKFNQRNLFIGKNVTIAASAKIGDNCTIYDNVSIGENSIIANDCVIGEPLSGYYSDVENYQNPATEIGANALIRSHAIIYAGNRFGDFFSTGHRVIVRENNVFGNHCHLGTFTDIQGFSVFGNYMRTHSSVHICQHSRVGDFVMIYPFVVFTNDKYPPTTIPQGPEVGNYTQIAVNAVLHRGVKVGKHCLIGNGSSIAMDMADYTFFAGNPAKLICDVRDLGQAKGETYYPWPLRFERGMPWEGIGYENWLKGE